jgi:hypothetical protein
MMVRAKVRVREVGLGLLSGLGVRLGLDNDIITFNYVRGRS